MRACLLSLLLSWSWWLSLSPTAAFAQAPSPPPRYLQLVNQAFDSVVTVQAAAQGQPGYATVALQEPLRGGGDSQTVALAGGGCRYDLRFAFADGRVLRYDGVDTCRYGVVRIRPLPRGAAAGEFVVPWAESASATRPLAEH